MRCSFAHYSLQWCWSQISAEQASPLWRWPENSSPLLRGFALTFKFLKNWDNVFGWTVQTATTNDKMQMVFSYKLRFLKRIQLNRTENLLWIPNGCIFSLSWAVHGAVLMDSWLDYSTKSLNKSVRLYGQFEIYHMRLQGQGVSKFNLWLQKLYHDPSLIWPTQLQSALLLKGSFWNIYM